MSSEKPSCMCIGCRIFRYLPGELWMLLGIAVGFLYGLAVAVKSGERW